MLQQHLKSLVNAHNTYFSHTSESDENKWILKAAQLP